MEHLANVEEPLPIFELPGRSMAADRLFPYIIAWRSAGGGDCKCCWRLASRINVNYCSDDALRCLRSSKLAQRQFTSSKAHRNRCLAVVSQSAPYAGEWRDVRMVSSCTLCSTEEHAGRSRKVQNRD